MRAQSRSRSRAPPCRTRRRRRNLNYWDSVSTLAGEVRDPSRTFPRAMLIAVALVVVMYLIPTMASLGVLPPGDHNWKLGFYPEVR